MRFRSALIVAAGVLGCLVPNTGYASLPNTIYTNSNVGDVLYACGYVINLGQYGSSGYLQAVNFGSGAGCTGFQMAISTNTGTTFRDYSAPPSVWRQVDRPGLWTQAVITVIASNGCVRQTTYRPQTSYSAYKFDEQNFCGS